MPSLILLHTVEAAIQLLEPMLATLAPDVAHRHLVRPHLLEAVQPGQSRPQAEAEVAKVIEAIRWSEGDVLLCSCSSIGGLVEQAAARIGLPALRIDRPMAEQAVNLGHRLLVLATLESTLGPTQALLNQVARQEGRAIELIPKVCVDAWSLLSTDGKEAYLESIVSEIMTGIEHYEVQGVVLAQASMAEAAARCRETRVPVVSSPRLGLQRALAMLDRPSAP